MRTQLSVPFVDSRADQLQHSLSTPPRPALQELRITAGPWAVNLRILGSSHQVIVDGLGQPLVETVACGVTDDDFPGRVQLTTDRFGYSFTSIVTVRNDDDFVADVEELLDRLDAQPQPSIIGVFPGDRLAVTALQAAPIDLGWKTWHCYPNTAEIVTTKTTITPEEILR